MSASAPPALRMTAQQRANAASSALGWVTVMPLALLRFFLLSSTRLCSFHLLLAAVYARRTCVVTNRVHLQTHKERNTCTQACSRTWHAKTKTYRLEVVVHHRLEKLVDTRCIELHLGDLRFGSKVKSTERSTGYRGFRVEE